MELKNNYINHLQYLNDNFSITNKKYYLIISLNNSVNSCTTSNNNSNSNNIFSLISFFNFQKKATNISNISSKNKSEKISPNVIPFKIQEEFKDINSIIYNTLTRACRNIRPLNSLEIFSLLKESFNLDV